MAYKTVREAEDATANKLGMGEAQRAVYDVIRRNRDVTNREIAGILGWEINRVTGRTHELRKMGLVAEGRKRPCTRAEGDQLVQAWTAIDPNPCRAFFGPGPATAQCGTCRYFALHKLECGFRKGEVHRHYWASCSKYTKAFGQ